MQVVGTPASRVPVLGYLANKLHRKVFKRRRKPAYWIRQVGREDAMVVQIGSNDGKQGDPLYKVLKTKPFWRALFVEPVPYLYRRLKLNYSSSERYQFACTAINNGETATFYHVDPIANEKLSGLPLCYDQLGSFDRNHILKHLDGILEPFIIETEIEGMSLTDLFTQYNVDDVTVLHIDTEGYDWEVLKQLDLNRFHPLVILYEHRHLTEHDKDAAVRFLQDRYCLYCLGSDILALSKHGCEAFETARWKLEEFAVRI